jgi:hypothetical protein
MHSLFCQLPNCNLFTQHVIYLYGETPLVKCGPRSILLHIYITVYFLQALFTFLQTNIYYHTICLILCLQQTSEIDNLTASWGKDFGCVVCRFHIAAGAEAMPQKGAINKFSGAMLLGDGARKEAAGVEQYVLVRGD